MPSFQDRLTDPRPILLDGATGTELNRRGVDTGLPLWSARALIEAPGTLRQIHLDYLEAGADVLTTNTFRTHARSLAHAGLADQAKRLTHLAVEIAQQAIGQLPAPAQDSKLIAGSISPLEDCYSPHLVPTQQECLREHHEMAANLADAGVDFLLIETMNTIREAQAAAQAAQDTGLPFVISFVCTELGDLYSGENLIVAVRALEPYSPSIFSVNCISASHIHTAFSSLASSTDLPLGVYANIGSIDESQGWENSDDITPLQYSTYADVWISHAPHLIGGCCGTSPKHIARLHKTLYDMLPNPNPSGET